jgi:predicted small lipoprotein YifL
MKIKLFYGILALLLMFSFAGCGDDSDNYVPPTNGSEPAIVVEDVYITYIFYDGLVFRSEADEYVEITNVGDQPQNLAGCVLMDIDEGYPHFVFPYYILEPGQSVRVYTNEYHPESGGFSFGYGKAIWNNDDPDTAVLYDSQGNELSRMSY